MDYRYVWIVLIGISGHIFDPISGSPDDPQRKRIDKLSTDRLLIKTTSITRITDGKERTEEKEESTEHKRPEKDETTTENRKKMTEDMTMEDDDEWKESKEDEKDADENGEELVLQTMPMNVHAFDLKNLKKPAIYASLALKKITNAKLPPGKEILNVHTGAGEVIEFTLSSQDGYWRYYNITELVNQLFFQPTDLYDKLFSYSTAGLSVDTKPFISIIVDNDWRPEMETTTQTVVKNEEEKKPARPSMPIVSINPTSKPQKDRRAAMKSRTSVYGNPRAESDRRTTIISNEESSSSRRRRRKSAKKQQNEQKNGSQVKNVVKDSKKLVSPYELAFNNEVLVHNKKKAIEKQKHGYASINDNSTRRGFNRSNHTNQAHIN